MPGVGDARIIWLGKGITMDCRHCDAPLSLQFVDLGSAPPSNAYLTESGLKKPELWFPLRVLVCTRCWLVQTEDYAGAEEIFRDDYAYFSSFSKIWLNHSESYVAKVVDRFELNRNSLVVELASNDGYLLQFVTARGIPCIGVEPTASTAKAAREKGLEVIQEFFGVRLARTIAEDSRRADLVVANNVLAHVPDINDFVKGISILLKKAGVATFEFPHLVNLMAQNQFDTIYHEHFSYLSLTAVIGVFARNGLAVFDVEELPTHGGSLRVYAQRSDGERTASDAVADLLQRESSAGVTTASGYAKFQTRADGAKNDFLRFLLDAKGAGRKVMGYGAAAKGNTLMNFAGVRPDLLSCVIDKNPAKQGKFLPGSRIPIVDESRIRQERPEYIVIFPWNIQSEVMRDLSYARDWGARFVTAIPELRIQ
jgi:SAM-dependent methyltransferase